MNKEIFRQKVLDKAKSPENLDEYIKVSNPGIWLLLLSVVVLLAGVCVWGIFGHIDSTVPASVYIDKNYAVCYVAKDDIAFVKQGMSVKFDGKSAKIAKIGELDTIGYECTLTPDSALPNGVFDGEVIIKTYNPMSFVLN